MDYFKQSPHTYSAYLSLGSLIQTCFADIPNPRLDERTEQEWFAYVKAKIIPPRIHIKDYHSMVPKMCFVSPTKAWFLGAV